MSISGLCSLPCFNGKSRRLGFCTSAAIGSIVHHFFNTTLRSFGAQHEMIMLRKAVGVKMMMCFRRLSLERRKSERGKMDPWNDKARREGRGIWIPRGRTRKRCDCFRLPGKVLVLGRFQSSWPIRLNRRILPSTIEDIIHYRPKC